MKPDGPKPDGAGSGTRAAGTAVAMGAATIAVEVLKVVIGCAERLGVSQEVLRGRAGLADVDLDDPEARVSIAFACRLSAAVREVMGPSAAIRLGEAIGAAPTLLLAYLTASCATLREAYETIHRYRAIVLDLPSPELDVAGRTASFGCVYPELVVRHAPDMTELLLAHALARGRSVTGEDWTPKAVHLQSPATDRATYRRFFRCRVRNGAPRTELVFDAALLDLPVTSADATLNHYLTTLAEQIVAKLEREQSVSRSAQLCIMDTLRGGETSLNAVAARLDSSPRSLQRHLAEENTSFAELLDGTRRVAALEYLDDPRLSISETALLLGFSEPSTFYRAFKRWTGMTPASYRRSEVERRV